MKKHTNLDYEIDYSDEPSDWLSFLAMGAGIVGLITLVLYLEVVADTLIGLIELI